MGRVKDQLIGLIDEHGDGGYPTFDEHNPFQLMPEPIIFDLREEAYADGVCDPYGEAEIARHVRANAEWLNSGCWSTREIRQEMFPFHDRGSFAI